MDDFFISPAFSLPVIDVEATSLRLKALREAQHIKVSTLQTIFGLDYPQAIYAWENPERKVLPRLDNLIVLANLYKTSIEEMIVVKHIRSNTLAVSEPPLPPFGTSEETVAYFSKKFSPTIREALYQFFATAGN